MRADFGRSRLLTITSFPTTTGFVDPLLICTNILSLRIPDDFVRALALWGRLGENCFFTILWFRFKVTGFIRSILSALWYPSS